MRLHELTDQIGANSAIDRVAKPATEALHKVIPAGPVKDALSGTWLGHPAHPLLTDVTIGAFTSAVLLDLLGGRKAQPAAKLLIRIGILSALPTAATGASDWSETIGRERRIGAVHAVSNTTALLLMTASLRARTRGHRIVGRLLALAGAGALGGGGYLGGHLSVRRGIGVNHAFLDHGPSDWTPVLSAADLPEHHPVRVEVDSTPVLLYRDEGRIFAIGARCTHAGGPLDEGTFDDRNRCVQCPRHNSVLSLEDGEAIHGPASVPQPVFDVMVQDDKIVIKAR